MPPRAISPRRSCRIEWGARERSLCSWVGATGLAIASEFSVT